MKPMLSLVVILAPAAVRVRYLDPATPLLNAMSELGLITIATVMVSAILLFAVNLAAVPARLDYETRQQLAAVNQEIARLQATNAANQTALEDADRYARLLDHGHSLLIRARSAPLHEDRLAASDEARGQWLFSVRQSLQGDYGDAIAVRFNFPRSVAAIGTDEIAEHEARLHELDAIIAEIRRAALTRRGQASA